KTFIRNGSLCCALFADKNFSPADGFEGSESWQGGTGPDRAAASPYSSLRWVAVAAKKELVVRVSLQRQRRLAGRRKPGPGD
ncbi:MAG: hypothetical protein AAF270_11670, partial [Pseudomonadota bacterium]